VRVGVRNRVKGVRVRLNLVNVVRVSVRVGVRGFGVGVRG
jgi:hypothetical protein